MKIGRFEITADRYQFILREHYLGISRKDGADKAQERLTFHATLEQCCQAIIQREASEALHGDVYAVMDAIDNAKLEIMQATYGIRKEAIA